MADRPCQNAQALGPLSVANEGAEVAEQSPQIRANAVADKNKVLHNHAVQAHPDKPTNQSIHTRVEPRRHKSPPPGTTRRVRTP